MDKPKTQTVGSSLKCYALRLEPGQEIRSEILKFVKDHQLKAAFILTCVGSITQATIRLANATANTQKNERITLKENFEIVSLVGTISGGDGHLHVSLANKEGKIVGGHVIGNMLVFTTAEIMIGDMTQADFSRDMDSRTGFDELVVTYK